MIREPMMTLALLAVVGCGGSTATGPGSVQLTTEVVASGLVDPVYLTAPAGDSRLFVVEQPGRIRIIANGTLLPSPFLDLTSLVGDGGERGLLSVAFHPSYATNGYFYVYYTDKNGNIRIERYRVSSDPNAGDPASAKLILSVAHSTYSNHNGGLALFGPDGMLYLGLGDGGRGGDPFGSGQNRNTLLGKLLRIDVDQGDPYAIPPDNPFVGVSGARGEVWAYGLRNPWRYAFDPAAGLLYIADVGQDLWEEVDVVPKGQGGLNFGWNIMEGSKCYNSSSCNSAGLTLPVLTYDHSGGNCSIIGAAVYRGQKIPAIQGLYFYSDYCTGWLKSFRYDGGAQDQRDWNLSGLGQVLSFGEDSAKELYILSANGNVYRLVSR